MSNIHFKTALDYIRRSPFQAFAAILVLTLTFFVGTLLSLSVYSSNKLLSYFETRPQIISYLKEGITPEEISFLQNKLTSDARVKDVRYVSKEEALSIYKKATSDNPLLSELVSPSIFPASLEFSVTNLSFAEEIIKEVKDEKIVDQVGFTANLEGEKGLVDVVSRLKKLTWYIRFGGAVFVGLLTVTSLLILLVIISMRISTRKGEIEILSLLGATPGFIRSPIVLEALIYSLSGVLLGWIGAFILILYSTPSIVSYFQEIPVLPKDSFDLFAIFGIILMGEVVIGTVLAFIGSIFAISRSRSRNQ